MQDCRYELRRIPLLRTWVNSRARRLTSLGCSGRRRGHNRGLVGFSDGSPVSRRSSYQDLVHRVSGLACSIGLGFRGHDASARRVLRRGFEKPRVVQDL
jgi:hypothetical protein